MDTIGKTIPISLERIMARTKQGKGLEYRYLWVSVNFATARDNHIRVIGVQAFGIFMIIRTYMDKEHIAYPSLKTIAYQSGCSVGTVGNAIRKLEVNGWIKKTGRQMVKGKYGNTKYLILQTDLIRGTGDPGFMNKPVTKFDNGQQGNQ